MNLLTQPFPTLFYEGSTWLGSTISTFTGYAVNMTVSSAQRIGMKQNAEIVRAYAVNATMYGTQQTTEWLSPSDVNFSASELTVPVTFLIMSGAFSARSGLNAIKFSKMLLTGKRTEFVKETTQEQTGAQLRERVNRAYSTMTLITKAICNIAFVPIVCILGNQLQEGVNTRLNEVGVNSMLLNNLMMIGAGIYLVVTAE